MSAGGMVYGPAELRVTGRRASDNNASVQGVGAAHHIPSPVQAPPTKKGSAGPVQGHRRCGTLSETLSLYSALL
jgi:hypothetical protein